MNTEQQDIEGALRALVRMSHKALLQARRQQRRSEMTPEFCIAVPRAVAELLRVVLWEHCAQDTAWIFPKRGGSQVYIPHVGTLSLTYL